MHAFVSDSIISISCGCVVQQLVRLAVRLADCCTQLAVNFYCGLAAWLSICCEFVVQLVVQVVVQQAVRQIHNKSK